MSSGGMDIMRVYISDKEREEAEELAARLGTHVDMMASLPVWMLPLFKAIIERIEALEKKA